MNSAEMHPADRRALETLAGMGAPLPEDIRGLQCAYLTFTAANDAAIGVSNRPRFDSETGPDRWSEAFSEIFCLAAERLADLTPASLQEAEIQTEVAMDFAIRCGLDSADLASIALRHDAAKRRFAKVAA